MEKIVTNSGFEIDVDNLVLDDMETFELICALDGGDATKLPALLSRLFTPEQKKALYDHVREEDGRVPISAVMKQVGEIFNALKDSEKK